MPASYLCDVMKGRKPASEKLLEHLELRKIIVYERTGTTSARTAGAKALRNGIARERT
jgi:hypothetical protein